MANLLIVDLPENISLYTWLQSHFQLYTAFWNEKVCHTDIPNFKEKLLFLPKLAPSYFFSLDVTHLNIIFLLQRRPLLLNLMSVWAWQLPKDFRSLCPKSQQGTFLTWLLIIKKCILVETCYYFVAGLKLQYSYALTQSRCIKYLLVLHKSYYTKLYLL